MWAFNHKIGQWQQKQVDEGPHNRHGSFQIQIELYILLHLESEMAEFILNKFIS